MNMYTQMVKLKNTNLEQIGNIIQKMNTSSTLNGKVYQKDEDKMEN